MGELHPIPLCDFARMELPTRRYILDPLLPEKGLMEIYAAAGVGKTTFSISLGLAASLGEPFQKWGVSRPWRVLYVDGEMTASDMRTKLEAAAQSLGQCIEDVKNFHILSRDMADAAPFPDIGTLEGQSALQPAVDNADLIFLDNLSCLSFSGRENDADAWSIVQRWLLNLRAQGKSIVMLHHTGKNGSSRGTSRRHDALDTVIKLERPSSYKQEEGAKFEVHFEKTRGFFGEAAEPVGLTYAVEGGFACWQTFRITNEKELEVAKLDAQGLGQVEIAKRLGIGQGTVSKRLARAKANGLA